MASPSVRTTMTSPEHHPPSKATVIFSFVTVSFTGIAVLAVVILFCQYRVRGRAPVSAAVAGGNNPEGRRAGVDITKLPEFAYAESARRDGGGDGEQCSVCLGTVQAGEMVRRLPLCKHLYHVECIDMWLASHTTCPLCRADVEPPGEDDQAAPAEPQQELPV
ncbi:hypothetical protein SEVIR_4G140800v4 [Setaria viridis]|uniref:RING-type E3 ubiquitin transferase n=3 Tax=Setaria TaxID=4554 RepID=A0A368QVL8_SETIT|nr:RING-H2 finger protein ATL39 [Setaria italica]XP_034592027.1 RING-H2 finger protein ATL39-like [Setaria viridis]RCV21864.1 hypothetical protein SETIT_4G172500v2 [Setaria italica]TKW21737.1 hypothetical protein SEVIR_4G140800v2 [Setaria viridis]